MRISFNLLWLTLLLTIMSLIQCTTDDPSTSTRNATQPLIEQIQDANQGLLDENNKLDHAKAKTFVKLTAEYSKTSNDTTKAIKYGLQGAEVAKNLKNFAQAIHIYEEIAKRFSDKPNSAANALFAKAFILENDLKELDKATVIYKKVLRDYPEARISQSIPSVLNALGKSEAELLEMIKGQH